LAEKTEPDIMKYISDTFTKIQAYINVINLSHKMPASHLILRYRIQTKKVRRLYLMYWYLLVSHLGSGGVLLRAFFVFFCIWLVISVIYCHTVGLKLV